MHPSVRPSIHPFILSVSHSYLRSLIRLLIHSCLVRRCSPLVAPQFGFIYPYKCTSSPVSGTICYLECSNGFTGNGGVNETRCAKDGKWSSDESLILQCLGTIRCSVILSSGRGVVQYSVLHGEAPNNVSEKRNFFFCHPLKLSSYSPSPPN